MNGNGGTAQMHTTMAFGGAHQATATSSISMNRTGRTPPAASTIVYNYTTTNHNHNRTPPLPLSPHMSPHVVEPVMVPGPPIYPVAMTSALGYGPAPMMNHYPYHPPPNQALFPAYPQSMSTNNINYGTTARQTPPPPDPRYRGHSRSNSIEALLYDASSYVYPVDDGAGGSWPQ